MVGVIVFISGLAGGLLAEDRAIPTGRSDVSTARRIISTFNRSYLKEHRDFFIVLLAMGLWGMAFQIFFPFLLIYLKHYLKLTLESSTLLIFISIFVGGILAALPAGMLSDRFGRKRIALAAVVVETLSLFVFANVSDVVWLAVCSVGWISAYNFWMIATLAWSKDLYPDDRRGEFSGYMTLFSVAFTMIPGPLIGGLLIEHYGVRAMIEGRDGIIPTPEIFLFSAFLMILPLIPVLMAKEKKA
jgi:MFS family permease